MNNTNAGSAPISKIAADPRIDPRLKALFGAMPDAPNPGDVASRQVLLAEYETEQAKQLFAAQTAMFAMMDDEKVAPSKGLKVETATFVSQPDGNTIKVQVIRPHTANACPASTTCTAAPCSSGPASTACTRPGAASSPRTGWRS